MVYIYRLLMLKANMKIFLLTILLIPLVGLSQVQTGFPINIPNSDVVISSSTTIVDLTGNQIPEIIVGDYQGKIYAYKDDNTLLWEKDLGGAGIESKPAVADLDLDGIPEVIVSAGSNFTPSVVGYVVIINGLTGIEVCRIPSPIFGGVNGVYSSPAVGNLDSSDPELEIAYGTWGATINVINHDCSILWQSQSPPAITMVPLPLDYDEHNPPYTAYVNDTVWSSPAIADINNDGQLDVIIGVDTHIDDNNLTIDGGRILAINGNNGSVIFSVDTEEVIWSSPAIADIDNDGSLDIIFGAGYCWQTVACAPPPNGIHPVVNKIYAIDSNGQSLNGWPFLLGDYAINNSSPAIADLDDNGSLEVVINAFEIDSGPPAEGKVFVINSNGSLKWSAIPNVPAGGGLFIHYAASASSPIVADINNDNSLDVVVPSNWDLVVWDNNGNQIIPVNGSTRFHAFYTIGSTASIADLDSDGDNELIIAGSNAAISPLPASIHAWDLATPSSSYTPWNSYRNGPRNNGVFLHDLIYLDGFE